MSTRTVRAIKKYRVIVSELQAGTDYLSQEELKLPQDALSPKVQPTVDFVEWTETEDIASASKEVIAGFLRAKANELDPPKRITRGNDYDA